MLKVHRCEDAKYDINWVAENCPVVMINRNYEERHEPTYSGVSMVVQNPEDDDWLMEFGHNEEGFLSVSDFTKKGRVFEEINFSDAVKELEENTAKAIGKI